MSFYISNLQNKKLKIMTRGNKKIAEKMLEQAFLKNGVSPVNINERLKNDILSVMEMYRQLNELQSEGKEDLIHPDNVQLLGQAQTIGHLKALIRTFDHDTAFGFRNQPMQSLYLIKYKLASLEETDMVYFQ